MGTLAELSATGGVENQQLAREGFVGCLITGSFSIGKPLFETTIHRNGASRSLIKVHAIRALADEFAEVDAKTLAIERGATPLVRIKLLDLSINQREQALPESGN